MAVTSTGKLFGWTEAQLRDGLLAAQMDHSSGSSLMSVNSGDQASQRMVQQNAAQRIEMFKGELYTLYEQDSETYSAYASFWDACQNSVRGVIAF